MRGGRIDRALMGSVPSERRVAPSYPARTGIVVLTVFSNFQLLQFRIPAVFHIFISIRTLFLSDMSDTKVTARVFCMCTCV